MAHFRGTLKGSRGPVSRLGGKLTGLRANLNAWTHGCRVELTHNEETDQDEIRVYKTGGSHHLSADELIKSWSV